ncbi:MAG TPA: hypothetical protein VMV52_00790 [Candidatus Nanopelagicaceae bacterium]|nr:hypothetical protein [Candidatus Nanopelagicaceae bacterium]
MMDWQYGNQGANAFGMIGGALMMIVFVLLAVWVVRQLMSTNHHAPHDHGRNWHSEAGPAPLEIMDARFARGEISLEDYTRDREALKKALRDK